MLSLCTNEEMHSLSLWLYQCQQNSLGKSFECNHIAYLENNKFKISPFFKRKSVCAFRYNSSGIIILERLLFILLLYYYFYYYIILIFSGIIISSIISKKWNTPLC